jgi:acetyl-CoA acetyltransferase
MPWNSDACIVGLGETEYVKQGEMTDRSEFELACEAIENTVEDAGVDIEDVDGFSSYANDRNKGSLVADALGIPEVKFSNKVWGGGGCGGSAAVMNAAMAVESGAAEYVVAYRALCQGQFGRRGQTQGIDYAEGTDAFAHSLGLETPPQMYALPAQRYMHEYDVPQEHLGHVALTSRAHANRNPRAVMSDREMTMDDYMDSPPITDPYKLYDCCLESDGACAVLVTSAENAADLPQPAVEITSAAQGGGPGWGSGILSSHNMPLEDYPTSNAARVADRLFESAGLTPDDIDVAQLYENFTGMVLMTAEDYGFAPRGEAGELFVDGNAIGPDADLPINTSGGNLSEAYIHGFNLVVEAARQVRGTSPTQVDDVEYSLVASGPGVTPHSGLILSPA